MFKSNSTGYFRGLKIVMSNYIMKIVFKTNKIETTFRVKTSSSIVSRFVCVCAYVCARIRNFISFHLLFLLYRVSWCAVNIVSNNFTIVSSSLFQKINWQFPQWNVALCPCPHRRKLTVNGFVQYRCLLLVL